MTRQSPRRPKLLNATRRIVPHDLRSDRVVGSGPGAPMPVTDPVEIALSDGTIVSFLRLDTLLRAKDEHRDRTL